ncbi:cytochrome c [Phenylobacterium sp.]|jgi:mono/diheme cytochrome c family protein|uniref:c-type cytochrome n=1 Tax=Phenylobacterium sp. TaxID=1871053 RepID=UPI002E355A1F|nr:cytochrome c [Phenylobacterium sp.]HEX3363659.1 cytochrome c [Phenylobacterium sp.]
MSERKSTGLRGRLIWVAVAAILVLMIPAGLALFVYGGVYDIGADAPHTKPVFWAISQLRDRSIAAHARGIIPPADLTAPSRIATGAGLYANLCTGCHLAPGMKKTDLSKGLYPKPPQLAYGTDQTPAQEFWILKHGIKLTAMPSWGRTHSDDELWAIVAFLKKMPDLDPAQYQAAVASAAPAK